MIDFDRKLIFIHIPKTGGSAIEAALLGEPKIADHDDPKRLGLFLDKYKDNFCDIHHPHATLLQHQMKLGSRFKDYKVFTVVRNPWDAMFSRFCYLFKHKDRAFFTPENFEKFTTFYSEASYLKLIGAAEAQHVHRILNYYDLDNEFDRMLRDLNLSPIQLPRGNVSLSTKLNYQDFYSEKAKEIVRIMFWYEICRFGWGFKSKKPKSLSSQDLSISTKTKFFLGRVFRGIKSRMSNIFMDQGRRVSLLKALAGNFFLAKKKRNDYITATVCSHPPSFPTLQFTIESIIGQVDLICVYLNNIEVVPKWLNHPKIQVVCSKDALGDLKSDGGHYFSDSLKGYCFAIDDDIIYPSNYVDTMIRKIEQYDRKAIVCVHGSVLRYPINSYYLSRIYLNFESRLKEDTRVDIGSNGTMAYHTDTIRYKLSDFSLSNMSDIELSLKAARNNTPVIAIKRECGWLRRNQLKDQSHTIYFNRQKYEIPATELIKKNVSLFTHSNLY